METGTDRVLRHESGSYKSKIRTRVRHEGDRCERVLIRVKRVSGVR